MVNFANQRGVIIYVGAALSFLTVLSVRSGSPASTPALTPSIPYERSVAEFKNIEKAAEEEGGLVFYSQFIEDQQRDIREYFRKNYPKIKIEFATMRGSDMRAKLKAEQAARKTIADLVQVGSTSARELKDLGFLADFPAIPSVLDPKAKWFIDPIIEDKRIAMVYVNPMLVLINTSLVPPDREPKTWTDLTDPWWKGKIMFDDPTRTGSGNTMFTHTYYGSPDGPETLKKIIVDNQAFIFASGYGEAVRLVARGEYHIYIPASATDIPPVLQQGGPVKALMVSPITLGSVYIGIVKGANHPNAAKVMINFQMGVEGQRITMKNGPLAARLGINPAFPFQNLAGKKTFPLMEAEELNTKQEQCRKIASEWLSKK